MGVLVQAMVWLGLPQPPAWQLVLYLLCIGMFGVGVGMLYTPILVDRLQLAFPSGLAVANILRALTDPRCCGARWRQLGSGIGWRPRAGRGGGAAHRTGSARIELSASTFGAGMIVGARIGVAALVGGLVGWALTPCFVSIGWLQPGEPFRKITFLIALGMIIGAALRRHGPHPAARAGAKLRARAALRAAGEADWQRGTRRLLLWVVFWGAAVVAVGHALLHQPVGSCCSRWRWCSCSRWSMASRSASATRTRSRRPSSCACC